MEKVWLSQHLRESDAVQVLQAARDRGVRIERVPRSKIDRMVGWGSHQGVVAVLSAEAYATLEGVLEKAKAKGEVPVLAILDGVEDPQNLGAILRVADGAGVHGVVIPSRRSVGLTGVVAKVSAGAVHYVPVVRVANIVRVLEALKKQGIWVVGVDPAGTRRYTDSDFTVPVALVLGSEGRGIRRLVRERCDYLVHISMRGRIDSLNVAISAGLVFYEVLRQRENKNEPPR